ncbi:amino acid adenylation domain-containing protein [Streptomyces sp. NBC_00320]|uniref:non-ribosomal peptide synthetase n=1 Tax=Streptomyces sp. NBC_00320 TaxID=2975711 RepID=UPI00225AFFF1|nr:non-ribosomal peptide synthetase [Streptomyces sp. NBC_00320]MCX5150225.1 amino acid adenylation domain-containing protein [Streptomyces sp. NBC_00320]
MKVVAAHGGAARHGSEAGDVVRDGDGVSFAQRRLWFLDQLTGGSAESLLPLALRIRGALDVPALERSLAGIVDRHEVLRTRFTAVDGEPVPVVDPAGRTRLARVEAGSTAELFDRELARPLDLAKEHPLRATLARLGSDEHVLLLVVHHIAVDGWSWDVLLRELDAGYRGEAVDAPVLQYTDVARTEAERLGGPRMERLLGYWRERLAGVSPLALPADRPRPAFWDGSGDVVRFELPAELVAEVDRVAREQRATRYMLLLAVYQALLGRYSGRSDIAVCTTLADRGRAEVAGLIGPFVNTIVLRTDLSGEPSFAALLGRVRSGALRDFSHSEAPFDRVVGEVVTERDLSRHPLAQASFTLLNTVPSAARLDELDVALVRTPLTGTPLDVFLDLSLRANGDIAARLQYSTALFDESTMVRFTEGYVELLRAVTASPGTPVAELAGRLAPLPGKELRRLVAMAGSGRTAPAAAEPFSVAGEPDAVALVCGEETLRYGELDALGGGLATALRAAGAGPGTPVGVCMKRGIRSVAAMTAIWRAGGVYVPLDPALPEERLRFMAAEAGLHCVLADAATARLAGALGPQVLRVEDAGPDAAAPHHTPDPRDLAYVIFTSGSTGRPKAVGIEHGAIAAHVAAVREEFGITARDRVLAFSSFSFDASLDQLLTALGCGAALVVRPDDQWLPAQLPSVVERHGITVLNLPPTYWTELAFSLTDRTAALLAPLRLLVLGGESVPAAALAPWLARAPQVRVLNAYGPTETTVTATAHEIGAAGNTGRVPIGRPLGSRRAYVADVHGELVPVGEPGELLIGGPELARGYLGQPALTAQKFVPDPYGGDGGRLYRTGDLVRRLPSGELEFLGRTDDQVKIRGFRIELGEVEAVLAQCPGVVAAAVAVGADAQGGKSLTGYVVAGPGGPVESAVLRSFCAGRLPHYAVPADFVALDALPVNASGKLDRAALPAARPDGERAERDRAAAGGAEFIAPRDATERVVAEIWAEVLGVDRVGIDDSFFDLGGHSLLATMAVSRIAERLGREVELRTLFENPRIREFGPLVAAARQAGAASVVPVDRSGLLPLSFAQERMWFLDRMSDVGDEYVLWFSWRMRGGLDRDAWQGALNEVVARHEALRTALVEVDGRPAQRVVDGVRVPLVWQSAPPGDDEAVRLARLREVAVPYATRRFDLAGPPLLRAGVWELDPEDHVAVIAFHHAATDGWSKDVIIGELAESYAARVAGRPAELPPVPVQYGDFAVWQRDRMAGEVLERQLAYWERALAGVPVLELPTDRPRPAGWSGRGGAVEIDLPKELESALGELARRHGVTRFTVLLAVLQIVLGRWSGQQDVAVGTPVAGRGQVELEGLVGLLVNTVVLRGDLSGEPSFTEFLGRVRESVLGAFDHQEVPFERLVEQLRPERDPSRNPLFQVMFDVQESAAGGPRVEGLDVEHFVLPWGSAKFDLTAAFLLYPDRFALNVEYASDLFDAATVTRFAGHVGRVLASVVADPEQAVGRLELLSAAEYEELAGAAGSTAAAPAAPFTVSGAADAVALLCGDESLTYGELDGLTGGLARALAAAGVRPGTPVGVCLRRGIASVAAMAAIWRAGGVYVPLDPRLPQERLRFMCAEAGVHSVFSDASTHALAAGLGPRTVSVDTVVPDPDAPHHTPAPDDLAYVIFTSGSTGRPKAVGVEHHALGAHAAAARELFGITAEDRVLAFASFSFDASLEQVLPALGAGASVLVRPDEVWSVEELAEAVRTRGVTVMEATPAYWEEIVARLDAVAGDLKSLRLLVTGGEALPSAPLARWFAHLPDVPVVNTYGPTEAVISATAHIVTAPVEGRVAIGRPLGSRRAYVVDALGRLVPVGVPGELLIGGPELARGYLGQPALTAERFVPDPYGGAGGRLYRTGDLVRRRACGELEFLGRTDDQVKIRGFRIEPAEIEAVLEQHPDVHAATVLVRELRGERALVGYAAGQGRGPDAEALAAWCRTLLPGYMVPAAFVLLDALPRTVQGKVDTAALPDPELPAPAPYVTPRTPTEVVTAQIWAEVLGLPEVGIREDFFALGGHSLRAVAAASRLRTAFDCPIQVRDLFDHPTVELLAMEVERQLIDQISSMSDDEIDLSLTSEF